MFIIGKQAVVAILEPQTHLLKIKPEMHKTREDIKMVDNVGFIGNDNALELVKKQLAVIDQQPTDTLFSRVLQRLSSVLGDSNESCVLVFPYMYTNSNDVSVAIYRFADGSYAPDITRANAVIDSQGNDVELIDIERDAPISLLVDIYVAKHDLREMKAVRVQHNTDSNLSLPAKPFDLKRGFAPKTKQIIHRRQSQPNGPRYPITK